MTPIEKIIKSISSAEESAELWIEDATFNEVASTAQIRVTAIGQFKVVAVSNDGTAIELTVTAKYVLPLSDGVACIQVLQAIILPPGGEMIIKKFPLHMGRAGGAKVI